VTNSAGPLLGGAGGSALFDHIAPLVWPALGVGAPELRLAPAGRSVEALAGSYGPLTVRAERDDTLTLQAPMMGIGEAVAHTRRGGNTFETATTSAGGMSIAFDEELLYLGPFAVPRTG
jgi:hypothetical protein